MNETTPPDELTAETLHCYTDGTDTVVALSPEDALLAWAEHIGDIEYRDEGDASFGQLPDDKPLSIICDEDGNPDDEGEAITKTAAEWARDQGRGFLCSTEY